MDSSEIVGLTPFGEWVIVLLLLLAAFMVVLWIFLPFAVFGIKERMDIQADVTRQLLADLRAMRNDQK